MSDGAKRTAERAKIFDILVNEDEDVLIALDARESDQDNPMVLVQNERVILVRNPDDALYLPDIPDSLLEKIRARTDILIAETDESGVVREYLARTHISA